MKKNIKIKYLIVIITTILFSLFFSNKTYASISMSTLNVDVEVGKTATVTMTAKNTTGDVQIISSNPEVATATGEGNISDNSIPITITGKSAGSATIKITGMAKDTDTGANKAKYSRTITVKVTGTASEDSTNADLSNLGIKPNDFTGFSPNTTTYNVTVPEDVQSIEVYATAKNANAKISGTGTQKLAIGENKVEVVVTANDGTTRTYTINVKREGISYEEEKHNTEKVEKGLSSLRIESLDLTPKFESNIYEYSVKYSGEKNTLDIQAVVTDPDYVTEIVGNENLVEGQNTITILVSDKEGKNIATYQINVNKSKVDEENIAKEEETKKQEEQKKMLLIAGIALGIVILIIIIICIKHKKTQLYAEEFSSIPFSGMNYDNNDGYLDNINSEYDISNEEINDDEMNFKQEENNIEMEKDEQKNLKSTSKEELKRKFLEGYNNTSFEDDYQEEKIKKPKHKGKRFK